MTSYDFLDLQSPQQITIRDPHIGEVLALIAGQVADPFQTEKGTTR